MQLDLVAKDACAWPVITRLDRQRLGLVHFNRPSHGLEEGDIVARVSTDDGQTWAPTGTPAPHPHGANRMHLAAGLDHQGRWIVLTTGFTLRSGWFERLEPVWFSIAQPPFDTWKVEKTPRLHGMPSDVIPHGRILALGTGELAATFYRSEGKGRPSRAWIALSNNHGLSWKAGAELGDGDANEVVMCGTDDGGFLAAARTQQDHHVALHRAPTIRGPWASTQSLTLPMQHPADLTDLGDDDRLLTYGIRNRGLMGIGARLSRDAGQTWGAPAVLLQFGDATDCGYPSTVRTAQGDLLTACYSDLSSLYRGYHLMTLRWSLDEFFTPRPLRSISDGKPLGA